MSVSVLSISFCNDHGLELNHEIVFIMVIKVYSNKKCVIKRKKTVNSNITRAKQTDAM